MSKLLQRLTDHLLARKQCRREDLDSWIDRCTIIPESGYEGNYSQLHLDHNVCTVFIERFCGNADELRAHLSAWLQDNDDLNLRQRYSLPDPDMDIEMMDKSGKQWDVDISIEFMEPVLVGEDPQGAIHWQGSTWSVINDPDIDVATEEDGVEPSESKA